MICATATYDGGEGKVCAVDLEVLETVCDHHVGHPHVAGLHSQFVDAPILPGIPLRPANTSRRHDTKN